MEPVFAALVAYTFYGERLGVTGTIGAGLILTGMLLSELKRYKGKNRDIQNKNRITFFS